MVQGLRGPDFTQTDIVIKLGDKLPLNRNKIIEELNNLKDRGIISEEYFRQQLELRLGYVFPKNIAQQIIVEKVALAIALARVAQATAVDSEEDDRPDQVGPGGRKVGPNDTKETKDLNRSNNTSKVNESGGTEVKT